MKLTVDMLLPPIGLIIYFTIDMLEHPEKYFETRLRIIESKLIPLTCIITEDVIRP